MVRPVKKRKPTASKGDEWNRVLTGVEMFTRRFQGHTVAIGGMAIYMHTLHARDIPTEQTHDADFYISKQAVKAIMGGLGLTKNEWLNKYQTIVNGIEFDLYAERQNSMRLDYQEIRKDSVVVDGIRIAHPEHLILLKLDALKELGDSPRGAKDRRDVAKLLIVLNATPPRIVVAHVDPDDIAMLDVVMRPSTFLELADGNAHVARKLRERASVYVNALKRQLL